MAQEKGKVGSLFFGMTLDANPFKKNLKKAQKQLKQAGKDMRESFAKIAKAGATIGAAFVGAGTGLLFFAKNTAEATNEQLLLADSIGATQEQIAGLDLAAQKLGVDQGMLIDKMREFGGIDEFKRLADQVKGAGDEQAQLNKALEIFGGEGAKILPVLQQGAAGLANMEAEARRLGLALSPEQIEKSRAAWSTYEETLVNLKGLGKQIGTALLEPFGLAAAGLGSFIETFREDIISTFKFISDVFSRFIRDSIGRFIKFTIPMINGLMVFAQALGDTFADIFNFLDSAGESTFSSIGDFFLGFIEFIATFKQTFIAGVSGAISSVLQFAFNSLAKFSDFLGDMVATISAGLETAGALESGTTEAISDSFNEQFINLKKMGRDLAKPFKIAQDDAIDEASKILERLAKKNEKDQKTFKKGMESFEALFAGTAEKTAKAAANVSKEIKAERSEKRTGAIVSGSAEEARILNAQNDKNLQIQQKQLKAQQSMATGLNRLSVI